MKLPPEVKLKYTIWSIKEIAEILKARRNNEFDGRFIVTGATGDGKSTLIGKILYRIKGFRPRKHQVYNRDDVLDLLKNQQMGFCWDDEAIKTGYKREFQQKAQQKLIKILTTYRDNLNIYASAIPNFYSIDKDLRDLYFMHLHVVERGMAIVHMPIKGRLYSLDKWETNYNAKIEYKWSEKMKRNPKFIPQYYRLTTFRGVLYFNKLTKKQEELYREIKRIKRQDPIEEDIITGKIDIPYIFKELENKRLTKIELEIYSKILNRDYSSVTSQLNHMLNDKKIKETVTNLLIDDNNKGDNNKKQSDVLSLVPDIQ